MRQRGLLIEGAGVLVAVSGGVDSMVLMRVLHTLAVRHRYALAVAHFNHRLRGSASDADARFVRCAARRLGLECFAEAGDVAGLARTRGWSLEMAARQLRHDFLARTAKRTGLSVVALAHHADDQVELFFLRLLRGAGGGLAGMKWRSISPADLGVTLVRPLLDISKEELLNFARSSRLKFRADASNQSVDILRNQVRRELMPLLRRRFQPAIGSLVLRTMEIVGEEAAFVQEAARRHLEKHAKSPFARLPVAVQRQCICLELARLGVPPEFELIERLRLKPGVRHSWQDAWLTSTAGTGKVGFSAPPVAAPAVASYRMDVRMEKPAVQFSGVEIKWKIRPSATRSPVRPKANRERFDADLIGQTILLRHWCPGDRFQPSGMTQAVKLQDLFTNAKVPAAERRLRLVAEAADGRIFWVEGLRIAEAFKLGAATKSVLVWEWRRADCPRAEASA